MLGLIEAKKLVVVELITRKLTKRDELRQGRLKEASFVAAPEGHKIQTGRLHARDERTRCARTAQTQELRAESALQQRITYCEARSADSRCSLAP